MRLVAGCALLGAVGAGLVLRGLLPARPSLAVELERLLSPTPPAPQPSVVGARAERWGRGMWEAVDPAGDRWPKLAADLAVMELSAGPLVAQSLGMAAGGAALALAMVTALAAGGVAVPAALSAWAAALAAAAGAVAPRAVLASAAAERRVELRAALAVVCDLAAVAVAGGDGLESAVAAAVAPGAGWAFATLRRSLMAGGARREPPWTALEGVGVRLAVEDAVEIGRILALAGNEGARVRDALGAQARSLRERSVADLEARAGSVTEKMSFPMVLLLVGFAVVIGYPALARL